MSWRMPERVSPPRLRARSAPSRASSLLTCSSNGASGKDMPPFARLTAWTPERAPNTRHSVSEFEPSRFAPFSDTQAVSPAA
jgi:hypothetical protein